MTSSRYPPLPDKFRDWKEWARRFISWSTTPEASTLNEPRPVLLAHLIGTGNLGAERPVVPGNLMFDPAAGINAPAYADGSQWVPVAAAAGSGVPTAVPVFQSGIAAVPAGGGVAVTFSPAFASVPIVTVTPRVPITNTETAAAAWVSALSNTSMVIRMRQVDNAYGTPVTPLAGNVMWVAIL